MGHAGMMTVIEDLLVCRSFSTRKSEAETSVRQRSDSVYIETRVGGLGCRRSKPVGILEGWSAYDRQALVRWD